MTACARAVPKILLGALLAFGGGEAHPQPTRTPAAHAAESPAEQAQRLNDEAVRLHGLGRYADALPLAQRALEIRERVLGRDHPDTLTTAGNLGVLYRILGRYAEAEPLYRRALEGNERVHGRAHRSTLIALDNLTALLVAQGHYAEAEPLSRRAVDGFERAFGRDDPDTLAAVANLAIVYLGLGRYAEAEPLYRRALEGRERVLGRDHPDTLASANNLALFYRDTGRRADAERLLRRALEGRERVLGRDHPDTLASAGNLAVLYRILGRPAEAEPLYRRALEGRERSLGPDNPSTLASLNNLAEFYRAQGRAAEAEPLLRRALETSERVLGRDHPLTLTPLENLAILYNQDGRYAEAEPLFERAVETSERVLGRDNPDTLGAAAWLVTNQLRTRGASKAIEPARLLIEGARQRRAAGGTDEQFRAEREREEATSAGYFTLFADAAWSSDSPSQASLRAEAFAALQEAMAGAADRAIAQQAAQRYADGRSPALLALIRERQQREEEWSRIDAQLTEALDDSSTASARPGELRRRLEQVQGGIEAIDARIRRDAPDYFQLVQPQPVSIEAASALLREDEAILLVEPGEFGTHVMAVTRTGVEWQRSDWNLRLIRRAVQKLRWDAGATVSGSEEELARLRRERPDGGRAGYDRSTAYELYQELVAPVLPLLAGKHRIYVAAGGALAGLPFSILVSALPSGADDDPAALRATHWFGDDFALVHIPSIQSLALLRQAAASAPAAGFLGVGDPVLAGHGIARGRGAARGLPSAQQPFRAGGGRSGGALADVGALRRMPSLPGTARELESVRQTLGAPPTSLLLAASATEPRVRSANLAADRIILFSTHGLTAAEAPGVGEAGLVLTPPAKAQAGDDGFLSASDVTTLRLNADWVILSACNTATGDGGENAGLGQLARAFFYAGARNLLASHWPVSDEVAPILITRTLALERTGTPRAEALRQAMREIRMDSSHDSAIDSWAHPFYWAPFVLIGDGGR